MKKNSVIIFIIATVMVFSYGIAVLNAASPNWAVKVNYETDIAVFLQAKCTPCHFPDKGGKKKRLDTYASASGQIIEILRRIQLNPNKRGFMPDKRVKLSDSTFAIFKQWQTDGLLEK